MLCAARHVPIALGIPGSKGQVWSKGKEKGEFTHVVTFTRMEGWV